MNNVVLVSGEQQSDSVIRLFFFKFFPHLGYYRILISVTFAIPLVLVVYLFWIVMCTWAS